MTDEQLQPPVERKTLTLPQAARILGISRSAAYDGAARGEIPTIRIGKRLLVPRAALEKMLADCATRVPA